MNRAAVVDEAFKLCDLRRKLHINGVSIRPNNGFNFECHADVAGLESGWCGRSNGEAAVAAAAEKAATTATKKTLVLISNLLWNLGSLKLSGITELTNNFDDGAVAALRSDARR